MITVNTDINHIYIHIKTELISSNLFYKVVNATNSRDGRCAPQKALKLHQTDKCTEKLITYTTSNCIKSNTQRHSVQVHSHWEQTAASLLYVDLWLYACSSDWSLMNFSLVSSYYKVTQIKKNNKKNTNQTTVLKEYFCAHSHRTNEVHFHSL